MRERELSRIPGRRGAEPLPLPPSVPGEGKEMVRETYTVYTARAVRHTERQTDDITSQTDR